MANCKQCRGAVSIYDPTCPHCGVENPTSLSESPPKPPPDPLERMAEDVETIRYRIGWILALIAFVVIVGILAGLAIN
jgi:hypothetical protein